MHVLLRGSDRTGRRATSSPSADVFPIRTGCAERDTSRRSNDWTLVDLGVFDNKKVKNESDYCASSVSSSGTVSASCMSFS